MKIPRDEDATLWRVKGLRGMGYGVRAISRSLSLPPSVAWSFVKAVDAGLGTRKRHKANALDRFASTHPEVVLPSTAKDISRLTGIPSGTVSACLASRRRKFEKWVSWVGPLEGRRALWVTEDGTRIGPGGIAKYEWVYDAPSNTTTLEVVSILGEALVIPVPDRFEFGRAWKAAPRIGDDV